MYRDEEGYFYHLDRVSDALDLGDGNWLYTALSEERILKRCPDVRDCTVLAGRGDDGRLVTEVLLLLATDADPGRDRDDEVRAALGEIAAAVPLRIVTIPDDEITVGPTGKVRKFLMRQRLLAAVPGGEVVPVRLERIRIRSLVTLVASVGRAGVLNTVMLDESVIEKMIELSPSAFGLTSMELKSKGNGIRGVQALERIERSGCKLRRVGIGVAGVTDRDRERSHRAAHQVELVVDVWIGCLQVRENTV